MSRSRRYLIMYKWYSPILNYSLSLNFCHRAFILCGTSCLKNDNSLFSCSTDVVVEEAAVEQMCPRFPEPVPLKHPISSLKVALGKVNLFLNRLILTHIFYIKYVLFIISIIFLLTDRCSPEVKRWHHYAASDISHCGFKWLCSLEWTFWQEEHQWPLFKCTKWTHSVQVNNNQLYHHQL